MNKKQSIEFCIQPPSPPLLPGISSILLYEQDDDNMSLISPTASSSSSCLPPLSPNSSIYSNHSNLEAVEPYSNSFHDRSPSLSPFMNSMTLIDTPTNNTPFLLPPPVSRSSSVSDDEPVKRKRGRPPNTAKNQIIKRDSWTFVTPTVWNVHQQNEAVEQEKDENVIRHSYQQQQENAQNTTFTNTNMDTTLSMPKKKRGRKPKMQLAGNFCFVWRESTTTSSKQQK